VQNVPENSAKPLLPWLRFKTDHALHREENKVEFLKRRLLDEKLPFLHREKTELSFELSLFIFCLLTVYFNLEMQNSGHVRLLLHGLNMRSMRKSANAERWRGAGVPHV